MLTEARNSQLDVGFQGGDAIRLAGEEVDVVEGDFIQDLVFGVEQVFGQFVGHLFEGRTIVVQGWIY